jgi:hypothetical protein
MSENNDPHVLLPKITAIPFGSWRRCYLVAADRRLSPASFKTESGTNQILIVADRVVNRVFKAGLARSERGEAASGL